ncbi:NADH-quinone oxidoreductase subunit N [bacterium BMS3Abin05]|nr:NADH-quinone oxidoreductase subunit N [bacterium BMS3Abin05]GBE26202.1 NADH-quinone oxidoreductase subunit N [bacterium BMS3Bbin03]
MDLIIPQINFSAIAPALTVMITAVVVLLIGLFFQKVQRELLAIVGIIGLIVSLGELGRMWGKDITGFGGMVGNDNFTIAFQMIFIIAAFLAALLSLNRIEDEYVSYGEFYGLLLFALSGIIVMVQGLNLLIVFLGLEILSISLYILTGFRKMRADSIEAALKYFLLGAFSTGFLLYGIALIYGTTGSFSFKGISSYVNANGFTNVLFVAGIILFLVGLAFKAAFVPFHQWTPDVYQGAPTPIAAFMSVGAKGAAFAVLIRLFVSVAAFSTREWTIAIWVLALLTMTIGNVVAIVQQNIKRMLAYSSIAHAGYILVGVLAGNEMGRSAVLFYLMAYTFMNLGAFGVVSYLGISHKVENLRIESYRGIGYKYPFAALAMAVFMFSLAGVPPTAGFIGKFYLFSAALKAGFVWLVILSVLNAVISAYYYLRVVVAMYMQEPEEGKVFELPAASWGVGLALLLAVLGVLYMGIFPSSLMQLFQKTAELISML